MSSEDQTPRKPVAAGAGGEIDEGLRRLDAAAAYLELASMAQSPQAWRDWARRLLEDVPGQEAEALRSSCR